MIAEPPVDGDVQLTVACSLPRVAETLVGELGIVAGVTEDDAEEDESPTLFVATTVNV